MRLLIERLQEYRTALITRTVTRGLPSDAARAAGLDPSPRLKPSGVEWLGDVPEHWEVGLNIRRYVPRRASVAHPKSSGVLGGLRHPLVQALSTTYGSFAMGVRHTEMRPRDLISNRDTSGLRTQPRSCFPPAV